jgi:hypothetical protein
MTDNTCQGLPWFNNNREKQTFKEQEFACVFAAGPYAGRPLYIGRTAHLRDRMSDLKSKCNGDLALHCIAWTAGDPLARRVVSEAEAVLDKAGRRLPSNMFDVTPELAREVIRIAADKARVPTFTHDQMLEKVRGIRLARIEAAIAAAGALPLVCDRPRESEPSPSQPVPSTVSGDLEQHGCNLSVMGMLLPA